MSKVLFTNQCVMTTKFNCLPQGGPGGFARWTRIAVNIHNLQTIWAEMSRGSHWQQWQAEDRSNVRSPHGIRYDDADTSLILINTKGIDT
jgi:hypothetical protein